MNGVLLLRGKQVLHALFLRLQGRTSMNTEQLAASILQVLNHHPSELVVWLDHLVVYKGDFPLGTEVVHGPVEH